jgi:hypothetical protein
VISDSRQKPKRGIRRPKPAVVPTVPPVFSELERLGLVVPVSLGAPKGGSARRARGKRR